MLRELLTGLREEALRLLQAPARQRFRALGFIRITLRVQESSCKDQLLTDASFKMQLLGMSLVQKDMQLGLSPFSQFERPQKAP